MDEAEARTLMVKLNQWAGYPAWSVVADDARGWGLSALGSERFTYYSVDDMPEDAQILGGLK